MPIANGAVRKCDMRASSRRSNTTSQSNSGSYQYLARRNAQLEQGYQIGLVLSKHIMGIHERLNMPVPEDLAAILQAANNCAPLSEQVTESSHAENVASGNSNDDHPILE